MGSRFIDPSSPRRRQIDIILGAAGDRFNPFLQRNEEEDMRMYGAPPAQEETPYDSPAAEPVPPPSFPESNNQEEPQPELVESRHYTDLLHEPPPAEKRPAWWKQALGYGAQIFTPLSGTDLPERLIVGDENLRARRNRAAKIAAEREGQRVEKEGNEDRIASGELGVKRRGAAAEERNAATREGELGVSRDKSKLDRDRLTYEQGQPIKGSYGDRFFRPGESTPFATVPDRPESPQRPTVVPSGAGFIPPGADKPSWTQPHRPSSPGSPVTTANAQGVRIASEFLTQAGGDPTKAIMLLQQAMTTGSSPDLSAYGSLALRELQRAQPKNQGRDAAIMNWLSGGAPTGPTGPGPTVPGNPPVMSPPIGQTVPGSISPAAQSDDDLRDKAAQAGITDPVAIETFIDLMKSSNY